MAKAILQFIEIINSNFTESEFVILDYFSSEKNIALFENDNICIYIYENHQFKETVSLLDYTLNKRYCEYYQANSDFGDYVIIVSVPFEVITIQRYWKRYRYNIIKKRIDPLKKELMEYIWNPSRLDFEIKT